MSESQPADSPLAAEEFRRNAQSRDEWARFAPHRQRVTSLIRTVRPLVPSGRSARPLSLALLGAGNLNDVDLPALLDAFDTVHLFDLDGPAMRAGIERQAALGPLPLAQPSLARIVLHAGVDLSGILPQLERLATAAPDEASGQAKSPEQVASAASAARVELAGAPFDVVASLATLSQLLEMVHRTAGRAASYVTLVQAVRRRHLQLLLESAAPGGAALLIFEIVSSQTCPQLAETPVERLPQLLVEQVERQNFFTGLNPAAVAATVAGDPQLRPLVAHLDYAHPWLWDLGPRTYAVTALRMTRSAR